MPILIELFLTFAKIGLFTFGGGYAMLSIIENICVERKNWITHDEMMNITVIAESTPGPIAINCATYVGYKKGKLPGAILATLGVTIPSFVIIFAISMFLEVGLFSFGGAYAAIPLIRDVVLAHGWMDDEMLSYMIAVSESTPGPIMVNLATYVGSNKGGLLGAVIATTAVMLPAFFIILFIMAFAKSLIKNPYLKATLRGLKLSA